MNTYMCVHLTESNTKRSFKHKGFDRFCTARGMPNKLAVRQRAKHLKSEARLILLCLMSKCIKRISRSRRGNVFYPKEDEDHLLFLS